MEKTTTTEKQGVKHLEHHWQESQILKEGAKMVQRAVWSFPNITVDYGGQRQRGNRP